MPKTLCRFDYPLAGNGRIPWAPSWQHQLVLQAKSRLRRRPSPRPNEVTLSLLGERMFRPLHRRDLPLVFLAHNDRRFLSSFLRHYRSIGVTRFICLDDQSTDGTREYLLQHDDVDVYASNVRYREAARGKIWREKLFDLYGYDRWYLNVDSDEYLIYESIETQSLPQYLGRLFHQGIRRLPAVMLDLYPDGEIDQAHFDGRDDRMPWEVATHFDRDGYEGFTTAKGISIHGGVQKRLFDVDIELIKYPLVYWDRLCSMGSSIHRPLPAKYNFTPASACLLHFKFFSDFRQRTAQIVAEGQHFGGSEKYRQVLDQIDHQTVTTFVGEPSLPYVSPTQLRELGFLTPLNAAQRKAAA